MITDTTPIRVLIVDDHPMVRLGLRSMLDGEPGIEIVGEAGNGAIALAGIETTQPNVVITDLRMPELDGVGLTRQLAKLWPSIHVVVVTTYETDADIIRAVEAGASGYLLKDAPSADLLNAVRSAARGETVLSPSVATRLMAHLRAPAAESLTTRETEVLSLVANGLTNADIGRQLFIGESTVKTHLLRTFAKLGVDDRTAAVTAAINRGLLPEI